jgi:galactoside O-acetyltransferase
MKSYGGFYLESAELRVLGCASVGEDVRVHNTCVMVGLENLSFGNHVRVDPFCTLISAEGHIRIGDYVHIAGYCSLSAGEGIELADFAGLSHGVRIYTRSDDYTGAALSNPTVPAEFLKVAKGAVRLARHVLIGAGTIVLPGCDIAEGATVGALSLVKSSLAEWGIYAGVPAGRLRDRSRDLLALERRLLASREGKVA